MSKKIDWWFEKDWLNGWEAEPDQSINRKHLLFTLEQGEMDKHSVF
jgi:hypothetical protein